jgi:hypothetical protein
VEGLFRKTNTNKRSELVSRVFSHADDSDEFASRTQPPNRR